MNNSDYYDSSLRTSHAIQEVVEAYKFRYLLLQLVRRDILTRYKRSFLGVAWTMLNPLGTMVVLTIAFSHLFGSSPDYPVYVLSGLMAWNFFAKSTTSAMNSMVWGGSMMNRIYLPGTTFSLSAIGTETVNLLLSVIPLFLVILVTGSSFSVSLLFLPVSILIITCFSLGVALLLSTLAIYFPDVSEMYQIILMAWFYLTPIIYPITIFPDKYRPLLLLNPFTYMVQLFHIPIHEGRFPIFNELFPALLWGIGTLIIGWIFFTKRSNEFAYYV